MLREGAHDVKFNLMGLFEEIQARLGASYLFIAHDLADIAHISQQIAAMYLGKIVEVADSLELCTNPLHPYTKALFATSLPSHPDEGEERDRYQRRVAERPRPAFRPPLPPPSAPSSCRDAPSESPISSRSPGHKVACYLYECSR